MAEQLIPFVNGIQYTGSNGAAIVAEMPSQLVTDYNIYIISESSGTLLLGFDDAGPNSHSFDTGDWVKWGGLGGGPIGWYTDEQMNAVYIKRSDLP